MGSRSPILVLTFLLALGACAKTGAPPQIAVGPAAPSQTPTGGIHPYQGELMQCVTFTPRSASTWA